MALFPDDFPFGSSRNAAAGEPVSSVVPVAEPAVEYAPINAAPVVPPEPIMASVAPIQPTPIPAAPIAGAPIAAASVAPVVQTTERRKALRQPLVTRAQLRADVGFTGTMHVEVVNISLLGVRLASPHPIDPQQKAQVRLDTGPLRWSSRIRVVTCQPDGGGRYALGCQFVGNEMMKPWGAAAAA